MMKLPPKKDYVTTDLAVLLWRAARLRCPHCGRGPIYERGYRMYGHCPYCEWTFEREEGYWTGAVALNLVVTELAIAIWVVPLAWNQFPMVPLILGGLFLSVGLPLLLYWHAKAFWMAIDLRIHPAETRGLPPAPPVYHEHIHITPRDGHGG